MYWPVYYLSAEIWCQQNVVLYRNCSLQVFWGKHIVSKAPAPDRLELLSNQYRERVMARPPARAAVPAAFHGLPVISRDCEQALEWPLSYQSLQSLLKALSFNFLLLTVSWGECLHLFSQSAPRFRSPNRAFLFLKCRNCFCICKMKHFWCC